MAGWLFDLDERIQRLESFLVLDDIHDVVMAHAGDETHERTSDGESA